MQVLVLERMTLLNSEFQLGGRYYWSDKWGLNLEFAGGNTFSTKLGVSVKF